MALRALFFALLFVLPTFAQLIPYGTMVGAVDETSAIVWTQVAIEADVRIITNSTPSLAGARTTGLVRATAATEFSVKVAVTGLPSRSEVFYRVRVSQVGSPGNFTDGPWGSFVTAPSPSSTVPVRFAVGGDVRSPSTHSHGLWPAMAATAPEFWLSLGDFPYADIGGAAVTEAEYRDKHRDARSDQRCQDFHRDVPIYPIWDDHEVINNWDGATPTARVQAGINAFHQMLPTPPGRDDIYRSFRWGAHLEVFLTDCRRYRSVNGLPDLPSKTMLGAVQEAWLLQALQQSTATFKLVAVSVPINFNRGRDSWPGFRRAKRALLDGITAAGVENVIFVSADTHRTSIHHLQEGYREFMLSPVANGTGSGWSRQDTNRRYDYDDISNFAVVAIDPNAQPPTISFEIRNEFGPVRRDVIAATGLASLSIEQDEPEARLDLQGARYFRAAGSRAFLPRIEAGPLHLDWRPRDGWNEMPARLTLPVQAGDDVRVAAQWRDERRATAPVLFASGFETDLGGLTITDVGSSEGPSAWFSDEGYLWQSSNINGPQNGADLPGTYATTGPRNWTDQTVRVRARSVDNDAFGVVFRYQDPDNHYLFMLDSQRGRRWLVRRFQGVATLLASDSQSFETWRWYDLEVRALGQGIAAYVDGELVLSASDSSLAQGGAGLWTWANDMVSFDDLVVRQGDAAQGSDPWLIFDNFTDATLGPWVARDDTSEGGPSQWSMTGGEARQGSNIGASGGNAASLGTTLVAGSHAWSDVRIDLELRNDDDDTIGVSLRDTGSSSYRFLMNSQSGWKRLVRLQGGQATVLAEAMSGYRPGQWYRTAMETRGSRVRVWLEGELLFDVNDPGGPAQGQVGLVSAFSTGARFDRLRVRTAPRLRPTLAAIARGPGHQIFGAAPLQAGQGYRLALAFSRDPGIALSSVGLNDPRVLPLALDPLFLLSLDPQAGPLLPGFGGVVGADGTWSASINWPPALPAGFAFELSGWLHDPATPGLPTELLPALRLETR